MPTARAQREPRQSAADVKCVARYHLIGNLRPRDPNCGLVKFLRNSILVSDAEPNQCCVLIRVQAADVGCGLLSGKF
jgi:hypothetical protein